jgi:hypothetical protein
MSPLMPAKQSKYAIFIDELSPDPSVLLQGWGGFVKSSRGKARAVRQAHRDKAWSLP